MNFAILFLYLQLTAEPLSTIATVELLQATLKTLQQAQAQQSQNQEALNQVDKNLQEINERLKRIEEAVGVRKPTNPEIVNSIINSMKQSTHLGFKSTDRGSEK